MTDREAGASFAGLTLMSAAEGVPAALLRHRHMRPPRRVLPDHGSQVGVMLRAVRVARDEAVEELVEELLGGALLLAEAPAGDEVRRGLELAAHANEAHRDVRVLLDSTVALRVGDDHVIAQALELEDGALVVAEGGLGAHGVEFEQELVAAVEGQARGPLLHAELHELGVGHLEAHGKRHAHSVRVRLELAIGLPHGVVVEVGVARVRGADDAGDAGLAGGLEHIEAHGQVLGAVVHAGKDVAVYVPHANPLPARTSLLAACVTRPRRPSAGSWCR